MAVRQQETNLRVPSHSTEAEVSVLGAILMDKSVVINVAEFLHPEHFYDERHGAIFEVMISLYEARQPIDILTVADSLKKKKLLEKIGGRGYLAELVNKVPTTAHIEQYGKIVKDAATRRSLMQTASRLVEMTFEDGLETADLLDRAEAGIFSLTQAHLQNVFTPLRTALADSFDRLDELHKQSGGLRGVESGLKGLDAALAGFQKSNLIILAARPGVGKSALALNIAQHVCLNAHKSVGIFSLEMSKEELVDRLLVSQADIDAWKLKTGRLSEEDFTKLSDAAGELAEAPLYLDDTPAATLLEMRTKARRLQVEHGLDLIVVDYLQLVRGRNLENRVQEVSEISQGLKNLARELKVPVIALSQLSRAVEQRGNNRPQLSDLRESGAIEQDADVVMFLSREDVEDNQNFVLDIAKHRNGPLRQIKLFFKGDRIKFFEREGGRE